MGARGGRAGGAADQARRLGRVAGRPGGADALQRQLLGHAADAGRQAAVGHRRQQDGFLVELCGELEPPAPA